MVIFTNILLSVAVVDKIPLMVNENKSYPGGFTIWTVNIIIGNSCIEYGFTPKEYAKIDRYIFSTHADLNGYFREIFYVE